MAAKEKELFFFFLDILFPEFGRRRDKQMERGIKIRKSRRRGGC